MCYPKVTGKRSFGSNNVFVVIVTTQLTTKDIHVVPKVPS